MEDIAPALIEKIQKDFERRMKEEPEIARLLQAILDGSRSYTDALNFGDELGAVLSDAVADGLADGALPNDTLYYNIARRLVDQVGGGAFDLAQDAAVQVQENINREAGIGLNAVAPDTKAERLKDLVNVVSGKPLDEALPLLDSAMRALPQGAASDTMQANMEFQGKAGLRARIVRTYYKGRHDCEYCARLAGSYEYPLDNTDVYRRHANCRCKLEYIASGKKGKTLWSGGDAAQQKALKKEKDARLKKYRAMTADEKKKEDARAAARRKFATRKEPENVLPEYLRNAKPGIGTVTYDHGYDVARHKPEIETAQWLHENLGGDIVLLNEARGFKEMTPDYIWNEKFWDLKCVTSEKSANSAVRHGLKQIQEKAGGIILNYGENNFSVDDLKSVLDKRMSASLTESVDILVIQRDRLMLVLRYKK